MATQLLMQTGLGRCPSLMRALSSSCCLGVLETKTPPQRLALQSEKCCRKLLVVDVKNGNLFRQYCISSNPDSAFKSIYKNPNVTYIRIIQTAKLLMLSFTPFYVTALMMVTGSLRVTFISSWFFVFSSVALMEAGKFASHVASDVYVNDDTKQVKISHFDFFGRQKHIIVDLDMVEKEPTNLKSRLYLKPDENTKFLLYLNLTTPEQREVLTHYFGDLYK